MLLFVRNISFLWCLYVISFRKQQVVKLTENIKCLFEPHRASFGEMIRAAIKISDHNEYNEVTNERYGNSLSTDTP